MTFGCQMNISDSERIHTIMKESGFEFEPKSENTDFLIMNTCSVKQKAEDKVWGQINNARVLRKKNKNFRLAVTGCMVRDSGVAKRFQDNDKKDKLFSVSDNIDLVFRIEDLPKVPKYLSELYGKNIGTDYSDELTSYFNVKPEYAKKFQVFVPIQTGCNKFCTYCIVPFTRKREISRSMNEIIDEVTQLAEEGAVEVTLLGQTVNSYKDPSVTNKYSDNNFVELLYHVHNIPGIKRIRYTSPHPMDVTDELISAHRNLPKLCTHIHLPLQSGDDAVLRRMNRKYTSARYLEIVKKLRMEIPDIGITTDIIVGFPGETEEEFMNTFKVFQKVGFDFSFTSRYSERSGTYSAKKLVDDVAGSEKARRWHVLNNLLLEILEKKNTTYIGKIVEVLVEKKLDDGRLEGMTPDYKRVQFEGNILNIGKIIPVKIQKSLNFVLLGSPLIS